MTGALDAAALAVVAAALVSAGVVLVSTRRPAAALPVLLDLLTAAGLLRLAAEPSWQRIVSAAAVVALRHLVVHGLRAGAAAWSVAGSGQSVTAGPDLQRLGVRARAGRPGQVQRRGR